MRYKIFYLFHMNWWCICRGDIRVNT